jgi:hypothetical protein
MIIIGLVGFAGSGKDTIGHYLINNYNFKKLSFANTLKDVVSSIYGWNRDLLEGITDESRLFRETIDPFWNITPRQALIDIGTNLFRNHFDKNIWVKSLIKQIQNMPSNSKLVITDCRFINEIQALKELKSKIVYVNRITPEILNDSEKELIKINSNMFDYILNNDKDINHLENQIEIFIDKFKLI